MSKCIVTLDYNFNILLDVNKATTLLHVLDNAQLVEENYKDKCYTTKPLPDVSVKLADHIAICETMKLEED